MRFSPFSRPDPKVCTVFRNAGNMVVGQSVGVKVICLERLQAITVVTRQTVRCAYPDKAVFVLIEFRHFVGREFSGERECPPDQWLVSGTFRAKVLNRNNK